LRGGINLFQIDSEEHYRFLYRCGAYEVDVSRAEPCCYYSYDDIDSQSAGGGTDSENIVKLLASRKRSLDFFAL
jgi:hypothetical protein